MVHPKLRQSPDGIPPAILHQCARNDLQRIRNRLVRRTGDARQSFGPLAQCYRDGHLRCTSTRREDGIENDITGDRHSVGQVPVDLVEDVFRGTAEEYSTRFGRLALVQEGEIPVAIRSTDLFDLKNSLVAKLLNVEQSALGPDITISQILDPIDNGRSDSSSDPIIVGFSHTPNSSDV